MDAEERPRVFVSYASERHDLAADIAAALQVERYDVFFDRNKLRPGAGYDAEIRNEIVRSQLFVILISPEIFKEASYVLTELKFAREAWPSPVGRVLPVMAGQIDRRRLDPYLRRLTPLHTEGDAAAEVAAEVHALLRGASSSFGPRVIRPEVAAQQMDAYRALWSLTGLLPKWPRETTVSYQKVAEFSRSLRDWYFGSAGGLFITSRTYSQYAELQERLQASPPDSRAELISEDDYDEIRHLCSLLRRQMAVDLGTRV